MDLDTALAWASTRRLGVLVTIRSDGRPQSSDIVYSVGDDGVIRISLTDDRAKTRNLARDPRCVLHITDGASWSYVSIDGTVELSAVVADPDDEATDELVELYRAIQDEDHPDWAEYRQAMVTDRRRVARFTPSNAVGQINTP
jgi:PPOX class probable F420-dependent enzyme